MSRKQMAGLKRSKVPAAAIIPPKPALKPSVQKRTPTGDKKPQRMTDAREALLADVAAAFDSERYLILIASVDRTAPRGKELKTRHHTRQFPSGDFQTACDVERPKFFASLHS